MIHQTRVWRVVVVVVIGLGAILESHVQTTRTLEEEHRFYEQASAALAYGLFDEAEALAATRTNDDPSAVSIRARMLTRRGRYEEAGRLLSPVAEAHPSSEVALEYGLLLLRTGHRPEAASYLQAVLNAGAGSRWAIDLYRAGVAARALGQYRDANALLRAAVQASPRDPSLHTMWAELFLEKYNQADAVQLFREALTLDERWAPAHAGLARALANDNPPMARASADRALEIDPLLVDAHLFIAEQELGDRNPAAARRSVERAFEINPNSLEARALVAAMAYLEDRVSDFEAEIAAALTINPGYGEIYRVAGSHTARAYRFDEAVTLVRRALDVDPDNTRAYAELGMHLLRTGDEPGARQALERAFADDPFNVITFNLLGMMDSLDEFETFERDDVIVRLHRDEAPVLKEYVISLAQQALDELSARYQMNVEGPILIEVFPRHDDFAVRNIGLPGMIGALGACFGRVVTMDSPRALPPGEFNWRSTLWHEIAHVITLQMSSQRVPRWLTEGISTYEEKRARPEWGRDQVLGFARALNDGSVLPLKDLNAGFSRPDTISMAYFQASVLVEHIIERYGESALRQLVRAYADGVETEAALGRVGLNFDTLQASFDEVVEMEFGDLRRTLRPIDREPGTESTHGLDLLKRLAAEHPDNYDAQYALGVALRSAGELRSALIPLERAAGLVPQATGIDSPRGLLASIAQELGEPERAMRELGRLLEYDATSVEAVRALAGLAEEAGDETRLAFAYDRLIGIDPFDPSSHQMIGRMAMNDGEFGKAIVEFEVALAVDPVDRVAAHCDLAEAYLAVGRLDEAKRQTLAALEIAPTYERAQELLLDVVENQP